MLRLARRAEKETTYVEVGEVATLDHEVGDNAVEDGALVVQGLARSGPNALLTGAERPEVFARLGHLGGEQPEHHAARWTRNQQTLIKMN